MILIKVSTIVTASVHVSAGQTLHNFTNTILHEQTPSNDAFIPSNIHQTPSTCIIGATLCEKKLFQDISSSHKKLDLSSVLHESVEPSEGGRH